MIYSVLRWKSNLRFPFLKTKVNVELEVVLVILKVNLTTILLPRGRIAWLKELRLRRRKINKLESFVINIFVFLFRLSSFEISFAYSIFNMVRKLNEKCYTFFSKEIEVENNTLNMLLLPYWTFT